MKIAKYIDLYNYLTNSNQMRPWEAVRTIRKIRGMSNKLLKALWIIMREDGQLPDVAVGDVSLSELVNDEGMNPVEALLMLDWLERDPVAASTYMQTERMRRPMSQLNEKEAAIVEKAIQNLKDKGVELHQEEQPTSIEQLSEEEKRDIETVNENNVENK